MSVRSLVRQVVTLARHLLLVIARKVLSFLLPLPFFPAVSGVLASFVGIDPLTLKPPSLKLPPVLTKLLPTNIVPTFLRPSKPPLQALQSETIELGEKIRTWRQRDILTAAERKLTEEIAMLPGLSLMDKAKKTEERPKIQGVDFGGSDHKEMAKTIDHSVEALQHIRLSPPAMEVKDTKPTQHGTPRDLKDEDYAKLSAEKQIFEQTKKIITAPMRDLGTLFSSAKSSTDQVQPEHSVSQEMPPSPPPHPRLDLKEPIIPPPALPPINQHPSGASSPRSDTTTSSIRLATAVGESAPVDPGHPPPLSAPDHLKEDPYIDDKERLRHNHQIDSAPQMIKSKRDVKKFKEERVKSTFDSAEDMLRKLGPSKDWSGMPHTPEKKKDSVLLGLPKLM